MHPQINNKSEYNRTKCRERESSVRHGMIRGAGCLLFAFVCNALIC